MPLSFDIFGRLGEPGSRRPGVPEILRCGASFVPGSPDPRFSGSFAGGARVARRLTFVLLLSSCAAAPPPVQPMHPEQESPTTRHTSGEAGDDQDPEVTPDGKTLLFASTAWGPTYDIYAKRIGESMLTRVTTADSDERFPKINPRRPEMIAFSSNLNGEWDVFVVRDYVREPGNWIRVSEEGCEDLHPSWSPDGTKLVYCSTSNQGTGVWILKIKDLLTGKSQVLEGVDGLLPEWNPKDNRIAFQRMRHRDRWFGSIWTVEVEGGTVRNLTVIASGEEWAAINPSWSADGTRLVFATVAKSKARSATFDEADDLWVVGADGSRLTRITTDPAADWMPTWSSTGEVFFVTRRGGRSHIWSLKPVMP